MHAEAQTQSSITGLNACLDRVLAVQGSDLHLDRDAQGWQLHCRIQGQLQRWESLSLALGTAMLACIKVKAQLDITEHRHPQEGRFHLYHQQQVIHCRVTLCPTFWGEKCSLRFLYGAHTLRALEQLGMLPQQQTLFKEALALPQGLIIVCGPTGSGKSQTLSAALQHLQQQGRHILTLEDPVEIPLPGVNHIQIQPKMGLDYAQGLKSCLRMDPDAIMIGEIRDPETAQLALHATHTGHLILSTVHAHDAMGVFDRMAALGVPTPAMGTACRLIINQRLIPLLCPKCKAPDTSADAPTHTPTYRAQGCPDCHQGYAGRRGLFECWRLTSSTHLTSPTDLVNHDHAAHITPLAELARHCWISGQCDAKSRDSI